jgi:hypothetical protein
MSMGVDILLKRNFISSWYLIEQLSEKVSKETPDSALLVILGIARATLQFTMD